MTDHDVLYRRQLVTQLRERFNALRMTVGVLGMEDGADQAAEWLGFVADAAGDCAELVALITGVTGPDDPARGN